MTFSTRHTKFELRAVGDNAKPGTIEGYASVFGNLNSYGEKFAPGAFDKTLLEHRQAGTMPKMLYMHDTRRPCGRWTDMQPDGAGLRVSGEFLLSVPDGVLAYELVKSRAIDGLSIGFWPEVCECDESGDDITLTIKQAKLAEVSIVTFPSDDLAKAQVVRSAFARGNTPTIREIEHGLRDALGLSAREAKALLAGGYKSLTNERDAQASEQQAQPELLDMLSKLSNTLKR
jgi:HK97 family phage prohead protease